MKTIDKKNWNKLSGLMNYSLRSTILVICFVAITAQFNKVYAQSFKKFKLGLDIETGISGNGHGFIYNGMIHVKKGPHSIGLGASIQKRNFDFGGGKLKYSITLTDLINNEVLERQDMLENLSNSERDNVEFLPYEYERNNIELNAFVFTQYLNNLSLSYNTIQREKMVGINDFNDWNKVKLSTLDFGLGFELKINLNDHLSWKNYIAMSGYYHTNYSYKLYHSKFSPCLNIGTIIEFTY
jgi:hypothetical protein